MIAIGSYIVEELQKEPVKEIAIYDNFTRGTRENIKNSLHGEQAWIIHKIDIKEKF